MDSRIVHVKRNECYTTSQIIAKGLEVEHRAVVQQIDSRIADPEDDMFVGITAVAMRNSKGRPTRIFNLTEEQAAYILLLSSNSKKVRAFKRAMVREFSAMRKELLRIKANHADPSWQKLRVEKKHTRRELTDAIKRLVEYAEAQGSQNAHHYYSSITKAEYKAVFVISQVDPSFVDSLNWRQLDRLKTADDVIVKAIEDGIDQGLPYKDIYRLIKARVEGLIELLGCTPLDHLLEGK